MSPCYRRNTLIFSKNSYTCIGQPPILRCLVGCCCWSFGLALCTMQPSSTATIQGFIWCCWFAWLSIGGFCAAVNLVQCRVLFLWQLCSRYHVIIPLFYGAGSAGYRSGRLSPPLPLLLLFCFTLIVGSN